MDLYTSNDVQTQFFDPTSFVPNQRAAFNLSGDKLAYLSNMRLVDLAVVSDGVTNYSRGLGTLALIKNIRLMDARTELGALRNPSQYLFFKNSNHTNADNKSNQSFMKRTTLGTEIDSLNNLLINQYNSGQATNDANTTTAGYIDLREIFPILNRLPALPTAMFPNLRLEIEFESNPLNQVLVSTTAAITVQRPVLCVDHTANREMIDRAMEGVMSNGVVWNEIESDNFVMPAVNTAAYQPTDEVRQSVDFQSMAFRGKRVERMLLCKQVVDKTQEQNGAAVEGFGAVASSQAFLGENIQYRLNGRSVLPGSGITRPNEALGVLSDEYGVTTGFQGSNLYKWSNLNEVVRFINFGGQQAWQAVRLGARVSDLQITLSRITNRDTSARTTTNAQTNINLYAEVRKILVANASGYNIRYA